jgi:hypothetical protein
VDCFHNRRRATDNQCAVFLFSDADPANLEVAADLSMKVVFGCVAVLALAPQLHAGLVHVWGIGVSIGEIDDSPALVVATVQGVVIKELAPSGRPRSNPSDRYWEAALRVHRAYSRQSLNKDATIMVRYISYGSPNAGVMNGPIWPRFEKGHTALFPLTPGDDGQWRLVADEGFNLTVPAIPGNPQTQPPASERTFILGELANTLTNGTAADRYAAAVYLREAGAWPDGFREVLDQAMGGSDVGGSKLHVLCSPAWEFHSLR